MNREEMLGRLRDREEPWDLLVVGGGATGMGVAVDAAARGHAVALLEQADFGQGTSSRSTKLIHGGVRYLQQGNISLVMEALRERGILRRNAPHLVHDQAFVVPNYAWWEAPFYGVGMKVYDVLAGRYGFGRSRLLSSEAVTRLLPTIEQEGLRGGVLYHDGQFDDSRLLHPPGPDRRRAGGRRREPGPRQALRREGGFVAGRAGRGRGRPAGVRRARPVHRQRHGAVRGRRTPPGGSATPRP